MIEKSQEETLAAKLLSVECDDETRLAAVRMVAGRSAKHYRTMSRRMLRLTGHVRNRKAPQAMVEMFGHVALLLAEMSVVGK